MALFYLRLGSQSRQYAKKSLLNLNENVPTVERQQQGNYVHGGAHGVSQSNGPLTRVPVDEKHHLENEEVASCVTELFDVSPFSNLQRA